MDHDHKTAFAEVKQEFERKRADLEAKVAKDYAILKDYKE